MKQAIKNAYKRIIDVFSERNRVTLKEICDVAHIEVPDELKKDRNCVISKVTCFGTRVNKPNSALFVRGLKENGTPAPRTVNERAARNGYNNGARFIFSTEQYYAKDGSALPCIIVEDPSALFIKVSRLFRDALSKRTKVVGITGSVGKTTTTEMFAVVANAKYRTYYSKNNSNGFGSISNHLQNVPFNTGVLIQEVGAYFPGLIESGAQMLEPNACVITNIGTSHIDLYGSVENITYDKLALTRHLKKDGMAFINYDDPILRKQQYDCNVTWYSLDNPEADYYADNVEYGDGFIQYDIVGKGSRTRIKLHSYGVHNIINSVAAFAFGCWCGISESAIAEAFLKFKTEGMRQNYVNVGGYRLYVDCFNSAPNSLEGAVDTLTRIPLSKGNKRIAVLGDMLKMGDLSKQLHIDCGKRLALYDIDLFLCYGPYMQYAADELEKAGKTVLCTKSRDRLNQWIRDNAQQGDLLLFKSGHRMHLSKTIDAVFGTTLYATDPDIILDHSKKIISNDSEYRIVEGSALLYKNHDSGTKITVPSQIEDSPVVCVGAGVFAKKRFLKTVVLGAAVRNIGAGAFQSCIRLKNIVLPQSLKIIEKNSFQNCGLESLSLPLELTTIGDNAFVNCRSLKKIVIGKNVAHIGTDAFANCPKLIMCGSKGSYAEEYAKKNGIRFEIIPEK